MNSKNLTKTVAVIFGGRSTEHDVSIITALVSVIKPLELAGGYRVVPIYISREGRWYSDDKLKDIKLYSSDAIVDFIAKGKPVELLFDEGLKIAKAGTMSRKHIAIDVVFPALHGTYGEDGALMGLLEMSGTAYVGCDMTSSALAMDKMLAKVVAQASGIPVTKFASFSRAESHKNLPTIAKTCIASLKFPLFVKPAHLGSSIGITRVTDQQELVNAIEVAAHYDEKILVEEAVSNLIEVTLPIMGNAEPQPALLESPLTHAEDFFDFDTKYLHGGKKGGKAGGAKTGTKGAHGYSQLPAEIAPELYKKAEALGLSVYKALGCSGTARVDMLIDSKTGDIYFNEVNPLPGSLYAHNWRAAGVSGVDLVNKLIALAEERHAQSRTLETTFSTNYLKQF